MCMGCFGPEQAVPGHRHHTDRKRPPEPPQQCSCPPCAAAGNGGAGGAAQHARASLHPFWLLRLAQDQVCWAGSWSTWRRRWAWTRCRSGSATSCATGRPARCVFETRPLGWRSLELQPWWPHTHLQHAPDLMLHATSAASRWPLTAASSPAGSHCSRAAVPAVNHAVAAAAGAGPPHTPWPHPTCPLHCLRFCMCCAGAGAGRPPVPAARRVPCGRTAPAGCHHCPGQASPCLLHTLSLAHGCLEVSAPRWAGCSAVRLGGGSARPAAVQTLHSAAGEGSFSTQPAGLRRAGPAPRRHHQPGPQPCSGCPALLTVWQPGCRVQGLGFRGQGTVCGDRPARQLPDTRRRRWPWRLRAR